MNEILQNIAKECSIDELAKLEELLRSFREQKKTELESSPTLYKFKGEYVKYIKNTFSIKYLSSVEISFEHLIKFFGEGKTLLEINPKAVEDFKQYVMNLAPKGYSVYLRTLRAAFNIAITWEFVTSNPFSKIKIQKKQINKPLYLERQDLEKILSHITNPTIKNIIIVSFYTGCRLGEVINLKWSNVDLKNKMIVIGDEQFRTKSGKRRTIPLCNEVYDLLSKCKGKELSTNEYVFSKSNGFPYNKDFVSGIFKEGCRNAGLDEGVHFHTLRHSFASNLANAGAPIIVIRDLMGHADVGTTQIYSHVSSESLQAAVNKFNQM